MSSSQFSRWLCVVLLVGCNAKLQVDPAASGGNGGAGAPGAGRGPIDVLGGDGNLAGDSGEGGYAADGDHAGGGGHAGGEGHLCYPTACSAGAGGTLVVAPVPGEQGQACIPSGSSVEADGSPAKTTVTTLDRCDNGLACDATKHCTAMPTCPQDSGPCVVHGVPLQDPEAGGGAGGSASGVSAAGAGSIGSVPTVLEEVGVMAMAADDTHLYWLEYGTRDGLGNYQHDGTLFSYAFADAKTTTIASTLPGPNGLAITSAHAYVAVDGGPLIGNPAQAQVLRLPLTGGPSELVQDAVSVQSFASFGDQAFWGTATGLYTVLPSAGAVVSTLHTDFAGQLAADAAGVYATNYATIFSVPQPGTTASTLVSPGYTFAIGGDSVYGIEPLQDQSGGLILDVVPKTGGTWARKHALGSGSYTDQLQILGDRYFFSERTGGADSSSNEYIETGLISSAAGPLRLVDKSALQRSTKLLWTGTATALFWTDGSAIFTRAVTGI
jgi:hypothetical protein